MDFVFYLTLFLFIAIFSSIDTNIDFDFWARLIVGKSFFQTNSLFLNDFQSWGKTHEFIDHEWGSSLIFYLIQNKFDDIGLYVFKVLIIFLTFFIIIKIIRLIKPKIKLNFLFFFFVIQSICYTIFATIRCQSFSFFFFVFYLYILIFTQKTKNYRVLWCLPVLNIIWLNMHGGFVLGLALIFIFSIGQFLNNSKSKDCLYYFYTFIVSCFLSLINPYGIKYLYYIFDAFMLNRNYIVEWKSAFFDSNFAFALIKFKIFFFITILLFLYSTVKRIKKEGFIVFYKNSDKIKYLVLFFTMVIALKALRCHVFFAFSVLAYCYCDFYDIFNKKLPKTIDTIKESLILFLVFVSFVSHILQYKFTNTTKPFLYPVYCVEFLRINSIKGNIFSNFHHGSYISYKLYPDNLVFMDGRYEEVYDNNLINDMAKVFLAINHKEFFKNNHIDILILDKTYPIVEKVKKEKQYFLAYEDDNFALFLNKKFKNQKFKQPTRDINYYNKTKFLTNINWID